MTYSVLVCLYCTASLFGVIAMFKDVNFRCYCTVDPNMMLPNNTASQNHGRAIGGCSNSLISPDLLHAFL